MDAMQKRRITELDMVKGIGILFVAIRHINEIAGVSAYGGIWGVIPTYAAEALMIMFFLISGYVYAAKGNVADSIGRRAKQLLLPILQYGAVVIFIYFIKYMLIEQNSLRWFGDKMISSLVGFNRYSIWEGCPGVNPMVHGFAPYWFVHVMFSSSCVFILVDQLVESRKIWLSWMMVGLLLLVACILHLSDIQNTLQNTYASNVPYGLVLINIFGFAATMLIGRTFRRMDAFHWLAIPSVKSGIMAVIALFIIFAVIIDYDNSAYAFQYGRWGQYGTISIFVTLSAGIAMTYLMILVSFYLKRITMLQKLLCYIGSRSLTILLLHFIIAETIASIGGFWVSIYFEPYPEEMFRWSNWFIVVVGTTIVLGFYLFSKDKLYRKRKDHV